MDIGTHIDNAALWGEDIYKHTRVVVSHMTRDSAEYVIESNNSLVYIHCPENCTVMFSQPVPHGVRRGQESIRHNTTHRVWVKNADLEGFFKSSKQFKINPKENTHLMSHLQQLDRWTIYIFPGNQWLALKKSPTQKHANWIAEFEVAKKYLTQDPVAFKHRRAWQTGTRFNYSTNRVEAIPSRTPEKLARLSVRNISQALPFTFTLRQSIYNEYFRKQGNSATDTSCSQLTAKYPEQQSRKQDYRARDASRNQHPAHHPPTHSRKQGTNSMDTPSTMAEHLAHPSPKHGRNQSSSTMDTSRDQPITDNSAPHLQHSTSLAPTKRMCRFGNRCWFRNLYCPFSHPL